MALYGIRAYALNGKRTSSLMAFNDKNLLRLPFNVIHCHFCLRHSATLYPVLPPCLHSEQKFVSATSPTFPMGDLGGNVNTLLLLKSKKTATHPCSGLFTHALPPLCTPKSAESCAVLCCAMRTSAQTFGKDTIKNGKRKAESEKLFIFYKKKRPEGRLRNCKL